MPAPAVYILAVVGTLGAVYAFHQFVYEPHLAPRLEQLAEDFVARRRARRMQQQGPIPIPLRRRGSHSDATLSDTHSNPDTDSHHPRGGPSNIHTDPGQSSSSLTTNPGTDFDEGLALGVSEWRSEVGRSQASGNLRRRKNVMDESINPIPHPTMSPTHIIYDTTASSTPTITTAPSIVSSPPVQVSPLSTPTDTPTQRQLLNRSPAPLGPSHFSQIRSPLPPSPIFHIAETTSTSIDSLSPNATTPTPDTYSPPSFSSPIPSLSQSYPQELDRERGIELLSPPSSGTSSPFTTFSPLIAPQALSPFAVVQPLNRTPSPDAHHDAWSPIPVSRPLSPSQRTITDATASEYHSLPASPGGFEPSSPVVVTREPLRSPSPQEDLPHPSMLAPVNPTSPNALSPRSPPVDLSDFDFGSDIDVLSDPGSEGSDRSWAGVSSASGSSRGRR